jgi:hypothetical protein
MFRKFNLQPAVWHQQPLEFEWDAERGEVRGQDADKVRAMALSAVKGGYIVGHPYPTEYDITDPLRNVSEMAVLLGQEWHLPEELIGKYPFRRADEDLPPGIVN